MSTQTVNTAAAAAGITPGQAFRRALNHTLTIVLSAVIVAVIWIVARPPNGAYVWVIAGLMTASVCYDVYGWRSRFHLLLMTNGAGAVYQFVGGMLAEQKFLLLVSTFILTYVLLRLMPNRACGCLAMLIGNIPLGLPGGFLPSFNRLIGFSYSFAGALIALSAVSLVHVASNYNSPYAGGFTRENAFRFSLALTFALWLMKVLNMPEGIWIPLSVVFIAIAYFGQNPQPVKTLVFGRIFGTPVGLYGGFLFMGCLSYFDYRMIYLIPAVGGFGFFVLYYWRSYFIYTLFFMMAFCLFADFNSGVTEQVHLRELVLSRTIATTIGVVIAGALLHEDKGEAVLR